MMPACRIDDDTTFLRQTVKFEGGEKHVEQTGVVAVFHILNIKLPVVGQGLREASNDFNWFVKHTLNSRTNFGTQISFNVGGVCREGAKYQTAIDRDTQFSGAVFFFAKGSGHTALSLNAFGKCNAC